MKHRIFPAVVAVLACAGLGGAAVAEPENTAMPNGRAAELAAEQAAGRDPVAQAALFLCNPNPDAGAIMRSPDLPSAQVFDNLWFVGTKVVSAWLWRGPVGVVLIDTLNDEDEARRDILAGLDRFGIRRDEVRVIVITHGHRDHSGGAATLKSALPHARVAISPAALKVAESGVRAGDQPFPGADILLTDGLVLGGGMRVVDTPGHSPGTVSLIFPVRLAGARHVVALLGGSASHRLGRTDLLQYISSTERFRRLALAARADYVVSNHPVLDQTRAWITGPAGPVRPRPLTPAQVRAYYRTVALCARAHL